MVNKIKVLYFQKTAQIGGAERDLVALLKKLNKILLTPLVFISEEGPLTQILKDLYVPYYLVPFYPWRKFKYLFLRYLNIFKLNALVKTLDVNIIHSNDFWYFPYARILKIFNPRVKVIVHVRGEVNKRKVLAYNLKKADKIIVVSHNIKSQLKKLGISSNKILVHYGYLNINSLYKEIKHKKHNKFIIGTVTRLFSIKGLEYLIKAGKEIKKYIPNAQILIVGTGDNKYTNYLQNLIKELNLERYVLFLGYKEDISRFLEMIDVFVFPSLSEGLGLAVLEAMAAGKPIVATDIPAMRELLENKVNALIVPVADYYAIAKAIIDLYNDNELCKRLGKKARETFRSIYLPDKFLNQLQEIYLCLTQ